MEKMKYITFYRENNDFKEILLDPNLKKLIYEKISWANHLIIGIKEDEKILSYITLKYGDDIRNSLIPDYSPIPNIDYTPQRR
jgi:hypothetical protein